MRFAVHCVTPGRVYQVLEADAEADAQTEADSLMSAHRALRDTDAEISEAREVRTP